jgi:hypothetical protein
MQFKIPRAQEPVPEEYLRTLYDIEQLAETLDWKYRIPLTNIRFGWDPVFGLIPIAGDLVMAAIGVRIIVTAHRLGAAPQSSAAWC